MLRKLGYKLGKIQAEYPFLFVLLTIIITIVTLPGIPLLLTHVQPSIEKILPQSIPAVQTMDQLRNDYGADMFYIVLSSNNTDIYNPSSIEYINSVSNYLKKTNHILGVNSIADIVKMNYNGNIPDSSQMIQSILDKSSQTYLYLSPIKTVTVIQVKTDTGDNVQTIKDMINQINFVLNSLSAENPGYQTQITGFDAINNATFNLIISNFVSITGLSFGLMVLFLFLFYKFSFKKTLYTLVIMLFSFIWTLGIVGYLGIPLDVVTMVSAAMIIALGSSYGINSVYYFYEEFLLKYEKKEAIAKFQEFMIIGLSGSAFAEIGGFMALLFGTLPSMHNLGIILAIGIFLALFVSIVILPVFFLLLEKDYKKTISSKK